MQLAAYVVATPEAQPNAGDLLAFLASRLPNYMLPSAFVALPALPLTASSKLDRKALPEPTGVTIGSRKRSKFGAASQHRRNALQTGVWPGRRSALESEAPAKSGRGNDDHRISAPKGTSANRCVPRSVGRYYSFSEPEISDLTINRWKIRKKAIAGISDNTVAAEMNCMAFPAKSPMKL